MSINFFVNNDSIKYTRHLDLEICLGFGCMVLVCGRGILEGLPRDASLEAFY
jgi:hypothetical protein